METKKRALGKGLEQLFNSEPLNIDTLNNYEKQDKQAGMGAQIGSASIVMIFAVLCLTIFAVLSFQTASHEQRLAQKTADAARAYYRADSIAEETYGRIFN